MKVNGWNPLAAELLDTLQDERYKRHEPFTFRTKENPDPTLRCPYCNRLRCREHNDLPALDPYYS